MPKTDKTHHTLSEQAAFQLANVTKTAPYMHNGKIANLEDVMWHYRTSHGGPIGQSALESATLTGVEFDQVRAFLATHGNFQALDAAAMTKLAMLPALVPFASPHGPGLRLTPASAGTDGFYFAVVTAA